MNDSKKAGKDNSISTATPPYPHGREPAQPIFSYSDDAAS